ELGMRARWSSLACLMVFARLRLAARNLRSLRATCGRCRARHCRRVPDGACESLSEPARGALRALARGGGLVGDAQPEDLRAAALVIEADQRVDEQPHGIGQREIVCAGEPVDVEL